MTTVRAAGVSETGPTRPINEDRYIADEGLGLFVVADGMGGHSAGEVAADLAVQTVEAFITRTRDDPDVSWPYGVDPALSLDANRMKTAICLANRRVFRAAESHDEYTGMGTTIAAALLSGSRLTIGHAGDSRVYTFANRRLLRETRDDSWIETLKALGQSFDPPVDAGHPMRNVLTNVLGARERVEVHILERELEGEEWIVLCSDGVHGVLDDQRIGALVSEAGDPGSLARALVDAALAAGSADNITAVVVRCG